MGTELAQHLLLFTRKFNRKCNIFLAESEQRAKAGPVERDGVPAHHGVRVTPTRSDLRGNGLSTQATASGPFVTAV